MTDDQMQTLRDDIAYMKALAQEGSQAPILGGAILVAAGVIFSLASVLHWLAVIRVLHITGLQVLYIWIGATVLFMIVLGLLSSKVRGKPGARSAANRASRAVWSAVGGSIFALGAAIAAMVWKTHSGEPSALFPSAILALWGTGWAVQAGMTGRAWMRAVSFVAWISAVLVAFFAGDPNLFLVYAACLLVCSVAPGLFMMRQEPTDVV